jgi:hypothetical protein
MFRIAAFLFSRCRARRVVSFTRTTFAAVHLLHHDRGLVAGVEGNKVRLSTTGAVAVTMEEERNPD